MTREEQFEDLRALLFSIAYRILGSVADHGAAHDRVPLSSSKPGSTSAAIRNAVLASGTPQ